MASNWSKSTQVKASGLLNSIPGYSGYRDKEGRRDADKQVRIKLAAGLSAQADRIDQVARDLATSRQLSAIGPVDALSKQLRHVIDRVANATYGYGGLFGNRQIGEQALDQIRLFDESLFASVDLISTPIAVLETAAAAKQDVSSPSRLVSDAVRQLGTRIDLRNQIIETGQPAPDAQATAALAVLNSVDDQKAAAAPPAAYDLHEGDALAVLGDNYIVDSRIEVSSAQQTFRLFRVDTVPDRWLFVPRQQGVNFGLLTLSTESFSEQNLTIGSATYVSDSSGSGNGEVAGSGGKSSQVALSFWRLSRAAPESGRALVLKWSGTTQVFTGNDVHPDDVELFGASKPT